MRAASTWLSRAPAPAARSSNRAPQVARVEQLVHREPRQNAVRLRVGDRGDARKLVGLLDEEPLRRRRRLFRWVRSPALGRTAVVRTHQGEASSQLVSGKLHVDLPHPGRLVCGPLQTTHASAIPDDHRTGSVVTGRDHRFEVEIVERVILRLDCKALFGGREARAPGQSEAHEHASGFESQVVVAPRRRVLVHDERSHELARGAARGFSAKRLIGSEAVALGFVVHKLG